MSPASSKPTAGMSLEDIERLGELLASIPEAYSPMEADMLDGYLTALALMENPPETALWLPYVFDLEGSPQARLADARLQAELRALVFARGRQIEQALLEERPIDPIVYDEEEDAGTGPDNPMAPLAPFADGFALACSRWPELVGNPKKAVQAALVGIFRYASDGTDGEDEVRGIVDGLNEEVAFADLDEALADLAACVQEIAEVTRAGDIAQACRNGAGKDRRTAGRR